MDGSRGSFKLVESRNSTVADDSKIADSNERLPSRGLAGDRVAAFLNELRNCEESRHADNMEAREPCTIADFKMQVEELRGQSNEQALKFGALLDLTLEQVSSLTQELLEERGQREIREAELRKSIEINVLKAINETEQKLRLELQEERSCREFLAGELQGLHNDMQMNEQKQQMSMSVALTDKFSKFEEMIQKIEQTTCHMERAYKETLGNVETMMVSVSSLRNDSSDCASKVHTLENTIKELKASGNAKCTGPPSSLRTPLASVRQIEREGMLETQPSEATMTPQDKSPNVTLFETPSENGSTRRINERATRTTILPKRSPSRDNARSSPSCTVTSTVVKISSPRDPEVVVKEFEVHRRWCRISSWWWLDRKAEQRE